jgi:hypothetical protein
MVAKQLSGQVGALNHPFAKPSCLQTNRQANMIHQPLINHVHGTATDTA